MVDVSILESEIAALEEEDTTYDTCERLACLYTVRDHLLARQSSAETTSEFLTVAVGVPTPDLMRVMNEHMEALRVVYPVEYEAVVERIKSLHDTHKT